MSCLWTFWQWLLGKDDKIDENKEISPAYKKIQCTAIMESCSDLIKEVNSENK